MNDSPAILGPVTADEIAGSDAQAGYSPVSGRPPVFGVLAFTSGAQEGAIIRDMRLANELHRRGFPVVVYWLMERKPGLLHPAVRQRMLMRSMRYWPRRPSGLAEGLSRILDLVAERGRRRFAHRHPRLIDRIFRHFISSMCDPTPDPALVHRMRAAFAADGITHLLPTHAMTCPLARAARSLGEAGGAAAPFDYLVTFQGEEIFANFIDGGRTVEDYYRQLRRAVSQSRWPAVVVSQDYGRRLAGEVGLAPESMTAIYPGIEIPASGQVKPSFASLLAAMPSLRRDLPIVSYFGRQDSEKGIDLLLYAARMLRERGRAFQLVISGSASFGDHYQEVCKRIAQHLRLDICWNREVSDELRTALYANSRCIVYPSIHREPFGMVAPEAMAHGTPVIVPDHGGITETIGEGAAAGGLTFRAWDSRDLADQLERLLTDDALHAALSAAGPAVAARFSVAAMTDQLLVHMGLPMRAGAARR